MFEWKEWDDLDVGSYLFYQCTLKVPIGNHKVGDILKHIVFEMDKSCLTLVNDDNTEEKFDLKIVVVESEPEYRARKWVD